MLDKLWRNDKIIICKNIKILLLREINRNPPSPSDIDGANDPIDDILQT